MSYILKTTLLWHDSTGQERESDIAINYDRHAGYAGDRIDPPCEASIEINDISGIEGIPDVYVDRGLLADQCMAHWIEQDESERDRAAEDRAERAREDRDGKA